jgi:hypothetical protein
MAAEAVTEDHSYLLNKKLSNAYTFIMDARHQTVIFVPYTPFIYCKIQ